MRGYLIWIAALGIVLALLLRSLPSNKITNRGSTVGEISKTEPGFPQFINTTSTLAAEPETNLTQLFDPPITNLEAQSPPEEDFEKIAALIGSMSETEVCEWLAKLTNQDLTSNTGRLLMRRWVELDPTAAVNWATQLGDTGARQELVDVVAVAWSEKDLPAALIWVEALPEDDTKHQALADLGYEVARIDPVSAMQIATQLPASDNSDALLLHALAQYTSADPAQSQQLALSLPPGTLRDQALATVATIESKQDGPQAATFAVENIASGPGLDRAIMGVIQGWAQIDFTGASVWVQSFPNSPIRDQAMQSLSMLDAR